MLKNCRVFFDDKPNGVFYSGERVKGHVHLNLQEPTRLTDLILKSKGYSHCQWTESYGGGTTRVTLTFIGNEVHYKSSMSLLMHHTRDESTKNTVLLEPGLHMLPFIVTLPENIPTSFESSTGVVRYIIKIKAIKYKKNDEKYKMAFTVISKCDLNTVLNCKNPVLKEAQKGFNSFFVSKGAMTLSISLPVSGFLPGQTIPLICSINNISDVPIKEILFSFMKTVTYSATSPWKKSRVKKVKIVKYAGRGVNKREESSYPVSFPVPVVPPTTLMENLPVTIHYELKIKAKVSSIHWNVVLTIPITVGNIPFADSPYIYGYPEASASLPSTSQEENGTSHYGLSPPTYEESQEPKEKSKSKKESSGSKKDEELEFRPRYPVFRFAQQMEVTSLKERL